MKSEYFMFSNIIKEEFQKNSFKTILKELSKICKSKTNKNNNKNLLLKIKIDIENTEVNIIEKLGKYYNLLSVQNNNQSISNIKKSAVSSFTSSNNSLNNSLIDKLFSKSSNYNNKDKNNLNISNKSIFSNKIKSNSNSKENILKDIKKRSNSHSTSNLIRVSKKLNIINENRLKKNNKEIDHQIDFSYFILVKNGENNINNYITKNKEIAKEILEFIDSMKLLQENIINKTHDVRALKHLFEKKKSFLYEKAYIIFNTNNENNNSIKEKKNFKIDTNYFNKTLELIKANNDNIISDLKKNNEILINKIKIKEKIESENNKIKAQYLESIKKIYNLLFSLSQFTNENKEKENNNFDWYIKQSEEIINNIKLNNSFSQKIINISDLNKDNYENENNTRETKIININSNKKEYASLHNTNSNKKSNKKDINIQAKDNIFKNIIEIIALILPVINGCTEKNESEVISKIEDDYEQQGIDIILYLLKSYINQLIKMVKEYQKQNNFRDNSNSLANKETNINTNSSKENDTYMQNIQKKFTFIERNNNKIFDDERSDSINNFNFNPNNKAIKTPNQTIKNICKEIESKSGMEYYNKIYSILHSIQNNLFAKIETKESEKIELENKVQELLKINREIKNNILSDENNIFLKKYNILNSLYKENLEKTNILEIEYMALVKSLCNFIQNGDKIFIKLNKIFNKYNKANNSDSIYNEQYELGQSNDSDLLSSIEKVKNDEIFHFLNQNDKSKNSDDLIAKYKKENEKINKYMNDMKIRLLTIGNNLNKLMKDKYVYNKYNDMLSGVLKLLNYTEEQNKEIF